MAEIIEMEETGELVDAVGMVHTVKMIDVAKIDRQNYLLKHGIAAIAMNCFSRKPR